MYIGSKPPLIPQDGNLYPRNRDLYPPNRDISPKKILKKNWNPDISFQIEFKFSIVAFLERLKIKSENKKKYLKIGIFMVFRLFQMEDLTMLLKDY